MSSTMLLGLLAALGCALSSTIGAIFKYKGARKAPEVKLERPLNSARNLLTTPTFLWGIGLGAIATFCNGIALSLAPLTLVKPIGAGSLILLGIAASWMLGEKITTKQKLGLLLVTAGLAGIVLTANGHSGTGSPQGLIMFEAGALLCGLMLLGVARTRKSALIMALSAGVMAGSADALIKHLPHSGLEVALPSLLLLVVIAVAGMLLAGRALQLGPALPTLSTMLVAANLTSLSSGFVVFGERLPSGALEVMVQLTALCLVLLALVLVPQPKISAA